MANVGVVGDVHEPFGLDGYLEFCQETFEAWDVDRVVFIGDLVDNHDLSFHDSEPIAKAVTQEHEDAKERVALWVEAFPKADWLLGNHCSLPARQLRKLRMHPDIYLKSYHDIYDLPETWTIHEHDFEIDGVIYRHGPRCGGEFGHKRDAILSMQSVVCGHLHSNHGVAWHACEHRAVFGLAVGCGVDKTSYAMAYGKDSPKKPIIGCGIVLDGIHAYAERMNLGEKP